MQFSERIGRMSRLKSIVSATGVAAPSTPEIPPTAPKHAVKTNNRRVAWGRELTMPLSVIQGAPGGKSHRQIFS
jgi:hypothetical protein